MNDANDIPDLDDWELKEKLKKDHPQFGEALDGVLRNRDHNGLDDADGGAEG